MSVLTFTRTLALLPALVTSFAAHAQDFSYDGNRWYEIEVAVFTNQLIPSGERELFIPEKARLQYPDAIRELTPAGQSFLLDFPTAAGASVAAGTPGSPGARSAPVARNNYPGINGGLTLNSDPIDETEAPQMLGPVYNPPGGSFRLIDPTRDPFISLGRSEQEFTDINRRLQTSRSHRVLFHEVWRQPVLSKAQSTAIFVSGGDTYGEHAELEGSMTFSFNQNRVVADVQIWLSRFIRINGSTVSFMDWPAWLMPERPFPVPVAAEPPERQRQAASGNAGLTNPFNVGQAEQIQPAYKVEDVYFLDQSREMISNELHYLDHPALGVLIVVRPYQLPDLADFSLD